MPLRPSHSFRLALHAGVLVAVAAAVPSRSARAQSDAFAACAGGTAGGFACSNVDLMMRLPHSTWGASAGAEIWGWTDTTTGKEYALVAANNGTAFVDVSAPATPVYLGRLPQPSGVSTSSWRTLRTYQNHVFVGSEASGHGVQVFDLTRLRGVTTPQTFTADARYTGNAHTLTINEATGFLFITGSNSGSVGCNGGGLHMVNIQTPTAPVFAGCYDADGYTHETQCLTYDGPDTAYVGHEICVTYQGRQGGSSDHVGFVDVTSKTAPSLIGSAFYPNPGYTHQGWLTDDRRHLLIDDEFDQAAAGTRTIVMNVADLNNPSFQFDYNGPLNTYAHNLYVRGNYAFLANYTGGMRVLDISGIESNQFTELAYFDTYNQSNGYSYTGQWMNYPFFASGTIVANDIANGLFVLDPTSIVVAGEPGPSPAEGFRLSAPTPNPTGASSRLTLTVAEAQAVHAEVYDVLGRRVAVMYDGSVAEGSSTSLVFEASSLPAGPYLLRVVGERFATTVRLSVAR